MIRWDHVADHVDFNLEISVEDFLISIPRNGKVLDFGCGYGRISNQLQKLGYKDLVGVDSSKEMINRGLTDYPELDLRYQQDGLLSFSDNYFDAIVVCAVLTCIPVQDSREKVVSELWRVLKPNGVLYLAEFCSIKSLHFLSGLGIEMWHSRPKEIEALLSNFSIELSKVSETSTISGHVSNAVHIIARKVI
ncbi:class I SAM-dependent methyltransferase [Vibrio metschnikovii]|nr:class I SAM-dependent methyltransferase [Vibrio metschnikovii]